MRSSPADLLITGRALHSGAKSRAQGRGAHAIPEATIPEGSDHRLPQALLPKRPTAPFPARAPWPFHRRQRVIGMDRSRGAHASHRLARTRHGDDGKASGQKPTAFRTTSSPACWRCERCWPLPSAGPRSSAMRPENRAASLRFYGRLLEAAMARDSGRAASVISEAMNESIRLWQAAGDGHASA